MDINNVTRGKCVPIGSLLIVIIYLASSGQVLPFMVFIGILMGIFKRSELLESIVSAFLASLIGSAISVLLLLVLTYTSYGAYGTAMVSYTLPTALYSIVFYCILGIIGGALGYYIAKEIGLN